MRYMPTNKQVRTAARIKFARLSNDEIEVDYDAEVSKGGDGGQWVQAWVWVSDAEVREYIADLEESQ